MFCEQCGNEFFQKKTFKKDGKEYVKCPFCHYENEAEFRKKKNKRHRNWENDLKERVI